MNNRFSINLVANGCCGQGLSGGDRIFIELARYWAEQGNRVKVFVCRDGYEICMAQKLKHENIEYIIWWEQRIKSPQALPLSYLLRTLVGIIRVLSMRNQQNESTIIYSAGDFWPDSLPAFIMKLKNWEAKWIACFYLFAPKPFSKQSPYKGRHFFAGLLSYIAQVPIFHLIKRWADVIFVTSEPDVDRFVTQKRKRERIVVIRGGVDTRMPTLVPEQREKKYDAVFIGRFHVQKGVLQLIDIWRYVCEWRRDAKLAVIGEGPLESEIRDRIIRNRLEGNISILGFQDGIQKVETFKSSKIVLHPAVYDSGGMAACEALACGLPGVSFDLESLKTYYPKGMLKTPCFDLNGFAQNIVRLLKDEELYRSIQQDALDWSKEWDWGKRAAEIWKSVLDVFERSKDRNERNA